MPGPSINRPTPGQNDVYWRRRVIALAAAVVVLGLIVWSVNGALGGAGTAKQAADQTHTGQHSHGAAATAPASPSPSATPTPAATGTATPRPTASASAKHGARKHSRAGSTHAVTAASHAGSCPRGSVVLSLFTTKYRYSAQQTPRFEVDVVSTAPRPCAFDLGDRHVELVIKAGGERRVWDSADCVQGSGRRVAKLTRGVPQVLRFSWDRKTSAPGCKLAGKPVQPGTYTATARSGALSSQSLIFVLAGPGVAVP
jgi:hypothetical protein